LLITNYLKIILTIKLFYTYYRGIFYLWFFCLFFFFFFFFIQQFILICWYYSKLILFLYTKLSCSFYINNLTLINLSRVSVHLSLSESSSSVNETTSVKKSLLGTSSLSLLLWLFVNLWGLTLDLTGTS